ncbi:hypothetical protein ACQKL5_08210 [Peribacillus sp. NPDC097675]|uniref:hypothetical protein n=1 Tax=Peribacillus sp. NPDC097675 TaxID=3390618 RepID=UPI003D03AC17
MHQKIKSFNRWIRDLQSFLEKVAILLESIKEVGKKVIHFAGAVLGLVLIVRWLF